MPSNTSSATLNAREVGPVLDGNREEKKRHEQSQQRHMRRSKDGVVCHVRPPRGVEQPASLEVRIGRSVVVENRRLSESSCDADE